MGATINWFSGQQHSLAQLPSRSIIFFLFLPQHLRRLLYFFVFSYIFFTFSCCRFFDNSLSPIFGLLRNSHSSPMRLVSLPFSLFFLLFFRAFIQHLKTCFCFDSLRSKHKRRQSKNEKILSPKIFFSRKKHYKNALWRHKTESFILLSVFRYV